MFSVSEFSGRKQMPGGSICWYDLVVDVFIVEVFSMRSTVVAPKKISAAERIFGKLVFKRPVL